MLDWIYDGIFFFCNGEILGVLVIVYNEIVIFKFSLDGNFFELGFVVLLLRFILYFVNFMFLGDNIIFVVGGIVFGEIIVWKFYLDFCRLF